ncbi:MAG TPA: CHAD domain-containing protein [Ramlibacter sp.]|uniref:CYTH and CHAD domain-containing protein n=1 Tax=Ramlibacter sp. TaxID=1917967 RepID=UPI002ED67454
MNEFELKFQVPTDRLAEVAAALQRGPAESKRLRARYFDTPDEALAQAGLVLRIRQEGGDWVQTAKGPGRGSFERLEHDFRLESSGADTSPLIARHRGHPVHELLVQALRHSPSDLQPTFETEIERLARTVSAGGASIEIALDRGEVRSDGRAQAVQEIEFELKEGPPDAVIELARSWCGSHGLWLDPQSKSALGRRLAIGEPCTAPVTAQPLQRAGRYLLAAILDTTLRQILGNARELAAGTGGDEHVHQLRVGIRRLRTALRELRESGAWGPLESRVEEALRGLFGQLGTHRDRTTLLPQLLRDVQAAGAPVASWQPALPDLRAAVRDGQVQDALVCLAGLARTLHEGDGAAPKVLRALATGRLQALHSKMLKGGRRFEELPLASRHKVRKRLKRLRYLAELVRPLYDAAEVDAYVLSLKKLQDALGLYQDSVAGRSLFEERSREEPAAWFGAGWLAAQEDRLARDCAEACRKAARKARPFWK